LIHFLCVLKLKQRLKNLINDFSTKIISKRQFASVRSVNVDNWIPPILTNQSKIPNSTLTKPLTFHNIASPIFCPQQGLFNVAISKSRATLPQANLITPIEQLQCPQKGPSIPSIAPVLPGKKETLPNQKISFNESVFISLKKGLHFILIRNGHINRVGSRENELMDF
jgi:hypothetical protein